jgi:hypothetical protein
VNNLVKKYSLELRFVIKIYKGELMKTNAVFKILFLTISLSACSTNFNKSQIGGALDVHVKSNLSADVEVDMSKKIQGLASATKWLFLFTATGPNQYADGVAFNADGSNSGGIFGPGIVEEVKAAAVYNAVTSGKAEIIVAPQYIMKTKSVFLGFYKEISVQVSGYAGRIKTIKSTN